MTASCLSIVIPGRAKGADPESILRSRGYGFRVRGLTAAPRNDSREIGETPP